MTRGASILLLIGALVSAATPSPAQEVAETILPDRPGLGDGAHVVAAGVVQLEVGFEASFDSGAEVFTFGQSLVRYGVGGIEIRVMPGSILITADDVGAPDPAVGLKVPLSRGDGPRITAVLATTLPVGSEAFSERKASGAVAARSPAITFYASSTPPPASSAARNARSAAFSSSEGSFMPD